MATASAATPSVNPPVARTDTTKLDAPLTDCSKASIPTMLSSGMLVTAAESRSVRL